MKWKKQKKMVMILYLCVWLVFSVHLLFSLPIISWVIRKASIAEIDTWNGNSRANYNSLLMFSWFNKKMFD